MQARLADAVTRLTRPQLALELLKAALAQPLPPPLPAAAALAPDGAPLATGSPAVVDATATDGSGSGNGGGGAAGACAQGGEDGAAASRGRKPAAAAAAASASGAAAAGKQGQELRPEVLAELQEAAYLVVRDMEEGRTPPAAPDGERRGSGGATLRQARAQACWGHVWCSLAAGHCLEVARLGGDSRAPAL